MAGNHGDEYEGQVVLTRMIRELEPSEIRGRVIIVPTANVAASLAGVRTSPIDEVNLNRAFPGEANATPTFAMAHYYDSFLFPMADAFIDVHSGGTSMDYLPFASISTSGDAAVDARATLLLTAFGAPISIVWDAVDLRMAEVAAARRGVAAVSGEFGGGGTVARGGVQIVRRGISNALRHLGILPANEIKPANSRLMEIPSNDFYVFAAEAGLFEPQAELGDMVRSGDPCGLIHFVDNPAREPVQAFFRTDGLLVCRRHPARVERGDCLGHLARDAAA